MTEFVSLPTPAMCVPGVPKHKKPKLMYETSRALLFPRNQPYWIEAGGHRREGFNVAYQAYVKPQDILLIQRELTEAGWWIDSIRVRGGCTTLVLVKATTVPDEDFLKPILVKEGGNAYSLSRSA